MDKKEFDELVAKIEKATSSEVSEQVKEALKAIDTDALKTLLETDIATKEDLDNILKSKDFTELQKQMEEVVEGVNILKDNAFYEFNEDTIEKQLKDNKDAIRKLINKEGSVEVVIKADTLRTSIASNTQSFNLPDIGQLAHRKLTLYDLFPKFPVSESNNNGTIRYWDWDSATITRAAASRAEGTAFPESTAKWVLGTIPLEKVGDTLPVSEEFEQDEALFAAELGMFLETNVAIKIDSDLATANGTPPNIKGIVTTVAAYSASASGITDASIYDLLVKVSEDITATGGSKYSPDFALMNITDINKMKLKKDANKNYIVPPFVSRDGAQVAGVVIIESNAITANTMVVGDRRYARIYEKGGIVLSKGVINAQFTEDMSTIKARKRIAFLIRGADLGGFKKVTDIDASINTLAS